MKKAELKELAKDILLSQLRTACYEVDHVEMYLHSGQEIPTDEDITLLYAYLANYGERMAHAVGREYYTR